jgi:hypothetical protein
MNSIECRVSNSMNQRLSRPFTEDEVRCAIFPNASSQITRTGWFFSRLLLKILEVVEKEVSQASLYVLNVGGHLMLASILLIFV